MYSYTECPDTIIAYNFVFLSLRITRLQMLAFDPYIDGLVHDCSNSSVLAMELLQSCAKQLFFQWEQLDKAVRVTN